MRHGLQPGAFHSAFLVVHEYKGGYLKQEGEKKIEESQALSVTPQLRGDEREIVKLTKVRTRVHTINTLLQPWATRKYRALNFSLANNRSLTT